jgi:hypothetical protein
MVSSRVDPPYVQSYLTVLAGAPFNDRIASMTMSIYLRQQLFILEADGLGRYTSEVSVACSPSHEWVRSRSGQQTARAANGAVAVSRCHL